MISAPLSRLMSSRPIPPSSIPPQQHQQQQPPASRSTVRAFTVRRTPSPLPSLRRARLVVAAAAWIVAVAASGAIPSAAIIRGTFVKQASAAAAAAVANTRNHHRRRPFGGRSLFLGRTGGTPEQPRKPRRRAGSIAGFFGSTRQPSRIDSPGRRSWSSSPDPGAIGTTTMASASSSSDSKPQGHDSETAFSASSRRLESPSAERNKGPIWDVLSTRVIPRLDDGHRPWTVLETAAGAGVHTEHFASELLRMVSGEAGVAGNDGRDGGSDLPFVWQPSDPSGEALESIAARVEEHPTTSLGRVVAAPKQLTLVSTGFLDRDSDFVASNDDPLDLLISINMIHISPWEATLGLMKVAGRRLRAPTDGEDAGGYLYCYGPYKQDGVVVPSNENFDVSLKSRNPDWGVRKLADVVNVAEKEGLELVEKVEMPANNTSLIFRRRRVP